MTRVLLISDTQRVQGIFQALAEQGHLQLQTASTLALGEFEIAAFSPDFTFVQSRISGFSGDILLRHLDKMLPGGSGLVLLAGDSDDALQARRQGRTSLDLSITDALLEQCVLAVVTGEPLPEIPVADETPVEKPAVAKVKKGAAAISEPERQHEPEPPVAMDQVEPDELPPPQVSRPAEAAAPPEPTRQPALAAEYPAEAAVAAKTSVAAFEDVMRQAETQVEPMQAALSEVEDRVEVRKRGVAHQPLEEAMPALPALDGAAKAGGGYFTGETVADALRRAEQKKKRRPYRYLLPALVLVAIPLVSYLVGRNSAPEPATARKTKPAAKPAPAPAASALPASPPASATASSPVKAAPPAAKPQQAGPAPAPAVPGAKAQPPQPSVTPKAQVGKPAPPRGVQYLPALLEGTTPDPDYGKKHPGWVRYQGIRAEYKLFQENGLYRAIQVIPVPGGTISQDLFQRVLRQFGGVDTYGVVSSSGKGEYVIEQCATPGSAAVTIYRSKKNNKMKALVVYYP